MRLGKHMTMGILAIAGVGLGASAAIAQDKAGEEDKPDFQFKQPAQQIRPVQQQDDEAEKGDESKAISPQLKEQVRPEVRRKLPAVQAKDLPKGAETTGGEMRLETITPGRGPAGTTVRIRGEWFGPSSPEPDMRLIIGDGSHSYTPTGFHALEIRRWTNTEIEAVIPAGVPAGEHEIAPYGLNEGRYVKLGGGSLRFEVVASVASGARRALPEDAGRASIPESRTGGFTPPAAGFVASCAGPDLAASIGVERIVANGDGSYDFTLMGTVRNAGQDHWSSGDGQQIFVWRQGGRELGNMSWNGNLSPGQVAFRRARRVEGWRPGTEFTSGFEFAIVYDPDISMDGNPNNDDCNSNNNEAKLSRDELAGRLAASR